MSNLFATLTAWFATHNVRGTIARQHPMLMDKNDYWHAPDPKPCADDDPPCWCVWYDEEAPSPKLEKLLTEPTVFDRD
jgi:hypothetical protein